MIISRTGIFVIASFIVFGAVNDHHTRGPLKGVEADPAQHLMDINDTDGEPGRPGILTFARDENPDIGMVSLGDPRALGARTAGDPRAF